MADLIVPLVVFVAGPLVSAAIVLMARLTESGLHPTTGDDAGPAVTEAPVSTSRSRILARPTRPRTRLASLPRTEISRG